MTKPSTTTQETRELKPCPWSSTVAGIAGAYPCKLPRDHEGEHDCVPVVIAALTEQVIRLREALESVRDCQNNGKCRQCAAIIRYAVGPKTETELEQK